ncbi:hypothetical protein JYU34_007400 [Plutella xylostella]|uniref:Uncharacterized protein n=1 Tax=Plutella xylostella TaxID=51655 RepID=A0ABQ7QQC3_PLUXY|nr:hypothetical protein JYU34_007400 [Plutella xylostella]
MVCAVALLGAGRLAGAAVAGSAPVATRAPRSAPSAIRDRKCYEPASEPQPTLWTE